jgi:hypothetical protein
VNAWGGKVPQSAASAKANPDPAAADFRWKDLIHIIGLFQTL